MSVGPHSVKLAPSTAMLAISHLRIKQPQQAMQTLEKALRLGMPSFDQSQTQLAQQTLEKFETLDLRDGVYTKDLETLHYIAQEITQQLFGMHHLSTAAVLKTAGDMYQETGNNHQAKVSYTSAINIMEQQRGSLHPSLILILNDLAKLYDLDKDSSATETLYRRVYDIASRAYGSEHPATAQAKVNLASVLVTIQKYDECESLLTSAIDSLKAAHAHESSDTTIATQLAEALVTAASM
eukprot:TRINITY_DN1270_c0_g1_i2.p1 TRINITY_DN1270_c0_g1~~TRINITY_DN1270_c0_g1_i2.p1  ORF type:complete len:239 (+),score=56.38 TRINITY_DN1270_c0_g1_i2:170-886(+)